MRLAGSRCQRPLSAVSLSSNRKGLSFNPARSATTCQRGCKRIERSSFFSGTTLRLPVRQLQPSSRRIQVVKAAIFGVGAPEALLVGVVALVVFGPKGLAQAVKSLGATLRTFSPTIRELASVTNELSSTLQEQIGLDEIRNEFRNPAPTYRSPIQESSTGEEEVASTSGADRSESNSGDVDEDLAAKIAESKQLAWAGEVPNEGSTGVQAVSGQDVSEAAEKVSGDTGKAATELSTEELEAELKRRKAASSA